jgi:predicted MFS family arabinose efflux permease
VNPRESLGVLAAAAYANFSQLGARLVTSPLIPSIILTFHVTKRSVGAVLTAMWAVFALQQYPGGVLSDAYGERRVILLALSVTSVASIGVALAPTFLVFGLAALALGAGAGLYIPSAVALLDRLFDRTGQALGTHLAGGSIAGVVVPVVASLVGNRFGWRAAVAIAAVWAALAALFVGLATRRIDEQRGTSPRDRFRVDVVTDLLSRPSVVFTVLLGGTSMFVYQSVTSFFPTFLVEFHGYSTAFASVVFGAIFLLSSVGLPALGYLGDRFSHDGALVGAFGLTAVGLGTFALVDGPVALAVAVVLVGTGFSWGGVLQSRITAVLPDHKQKHGFGLVRAAYMLVGSTGSVTTGVLAGQVGWLGAIGASIAALGVGIAALVLNRALRRGL